MAGLSLSGDDATLVGGLGSDTITGGATNQVIFGDEEQTDPAVAAAVTAGAGDSIDGLGGNDTLYGQGGDDTLSGSAGFNALFGGPGNDRLLDGGDAGSIETMAGGAGDDTLIGGAGTDYLFGDDVDFFGAPPSAVSGNDVLDGGDGADLLSGGPGNDSIDGGAGQDQIFGGAGDDILSPGTPDPIFSLFDSLQGGEGVDALALPGRPEDYAFSAPGGPVDVVQSNPGVAPAGEARATLTEIEAVAFGVSALDLANGAAPLTTVEYADLFFGSSNNGNGGRPHWSLSDSVAALLASNVVPIDIGTLLANDVDPDGGSLTLVDFFPTAPVGGPGMTFRVLLTASDIENEGYDPSLYPDGLLEIVVAQPVVAPVRFTYRTLAEEDGGAADLGSIATVTINPVVATADQLRATYGAETFIPYATLLANDGPGAVWGGLSNAFASDGSTIVDDPARGGVVIDSPGPFLGGNAFFDYSLAGVPGTATVSIEIDNGAPVAVPLARVVTPGTTFTITFDEIAGHDGHLDPNLDNLVFGAVTGSSGSGATFTVTATGIDITFDATYSGGFSIGYTLADTPLGAVSAPSTISFLTAAPPPPVAVTDALTWGIGDGVSLFDGSRPGYGVVWSRELLANDSFMPGTVRLWNAPFDLTPFDNSQVVRVLERGIPGIFGVTDPTDNGFGLEFRPGITSDTLVYTIIDPLGREAQGQIIFNVSVPQPQPADNVIVVPLGATSVTVTAADILGNDVFTGVGAIAEVLGIGVGGIVDSGVDIGGGRTGIDRFTVDFNPPGLSPDLPLSAFTLNILTFDTAADGGSANGSQRVTFVRETAPPPTTYSLFSVITTTGEGTANQLSFPFNISRTGTLDAATVTVTLGAGTNGDPAESDDFRDGFGSFTFSFAAGQSTITAGLPIANDTIFEPDETFRITLTGATNTGQQIILDAAASVIDGTIRNDDAPPVFSIAAVNASFLEGTPPGPGGTLEFVITRTGDLSSAATVTWASAPGAVNGVEAEDVGGIFPFGSVTLAAGVAQATVPLIVVPDDLDEQNETLEVTLTGTTVGTIGAASSTNFTILDEAEDAIEEGRPPTPTFSLTLLDNVATEGSAPGSGGTIALRIERTGSTAEAATVTYSVGAGTPAASADDLLGGFGEFTVAFAAGQAFADIVLTATPDTAIEPNEQIEVALVATTLGAFDSTPVTATIFNDDVPPPTGPLFYFSGFTPNSQHELWVFDPNQTLPDGRPYATMIDAAEVEFPFPDPSGGVDVQTAPREITAFGGSVLWRQPHPFTDGEQWFRWDGSSLSTVWLVDPLFTANNGDFDGALPIEDRNLGIVSGGLFWTYGAGGVFTNFAQSLEFVAFDANGIQVTTASPVTNGQQPPRGVEGPRQLTDAGGTPAFAASVRSLSQLFEHVFLLLPSDASGVAYDPVQATRGQNPLQAVREIEGLSIVGDPPGSGARAKTFYFSGDWDDDASGAFRTEALWTQTLRQEPGAEWLVDGEPIFLDVNGTGGSLPLAPEALTIAATGAGDRLFFFGCVQEVNSGVSEALFALAENASGAPSWQSASGLFLVDGFEIAPWAGGVLLSGQRDAEGSGAATPFVATWTDADGDGSFTLDLLTDGPFGAGTLAFPTAGVVEHLTADGQGRAAWVVDTGARDSLWVFDRTETYAVAELVGEIDELQLGGGLLVYRQDAFGAADFLKLFVHDIASSTSREIATDEPLGTAPGYRPDQVVAVPGGPATNGGTLPDNGARADLAVTLVLDTIEDSVPAGSDIDLLVRIANAGPDAASGTLRLTPGVGVSFTTTREGFDPATGLLTFGPIAPGDFFETAINTVFGLDGTPDITAEILTSTADDPDSTPGNGTANSEDDTFATGISVTEVLPAIRGTAGADTIAPASDGGSSPGVSGTPGATRERIEALGGNDLILASGGPDITEGGAGDDTFAFTSQAAFTEPGRILDGGADTDTLLFRSSVTLTDAAFAGVSGMEAIAARTSGPISLTFGAEAARAFAGGITIDLTGAGTPAPGLVVDGSALTAATPLRVLATDAQDTIRGGAGNDSFVGAGGADLLDGGAGDDTFAFVDITDILTGAGAWLVPGRRIEGGAGTDTLVFHENVVFQGASFAGVSGMEAIHLAGSRALIDFGAAAAAAFGPRITITAGPTTSTGITAVDLSPGSALDFFGGDTIDGVFGSNGNDLLLGRGGNDVMGGQRGQDTLEGGAGDDSLDLLLDATGSGRDRVRGDAGTDSLTLDMTEARLAIPEVQAELLRLKAQLDALPPGSEGPSFVSDVLQLDMAGVETVHITLDRNEALTLDQATRPLGPAVVNDTLTLPENDAGTIARLVDVLANDERGGSTRLSLQAVDTAGTPILAEIVLDAITGEPLISVRVDDPSNETTGVFAVTYTASNRFGTATGTLTITVTPENDAPVGVADRVGTTRNTAVTFDILANDIDVDRDALFAGGFTLPANGTLAINGGIVTYTPRAGFSGTDSFTYRPFDGALQGAPTTVTVTVSAPTGNRPPTDITLTNASVLETLPVGTLVGLLSATDPDAGDTLSFSFAANGNPGGLFALDGNRLITAAPLDFETAPFHDLTLRATDSAGNSYDETFRITVGDLAEGAAVQPAVINAPGFAISQQLGGRPPGSQPGGPALSTGALGAVATTPVTLPGESVPRARIENTGTWNDLKNLTLGADYWRPSLGTDLLVANFVDVRWDLSAAPPLDFDLQVVGAKRGEVDFGAGNDTLTWLFHSNGDGPINTATVTAGAGNDTLSFSSVGSSGVDDLLLADNPQPSNGSLWNPAYNGRFSTSIAFGGAGDDRIEAQGSVRLQADGGEGLDTLIGSLRNDTLIGGLGEDTLTGGGDGGSFRFSGNRAARRVVLSGGDLIDLRGPGGGGDGAADTVTYDVQGGGVDRVIGFEAGRDKISLLGGAGVTQLTEYRNGTFLSFSGRPLQGVLIEGVTGLSLGGPAADIQLLA